MQDVERTPRGWLARSWERLRHWFVPESLRAEPDEAQRAEVLLVFWTAGMTVALLYGLASCAVGAVFQGSAVLGVFVLGFAVPLAFRLTRSSVFIGNVGCGLWFLVMVLAAYVPDGIGMYAVIASLSVPMIAVLAAGPVWGLLWGALSCIQVVAFALVAPQPAAPTRVGFLEVFGSLLYVATLVFIAVAYDLVGREAVRRRRESDALARDAREETAMLRADRMASVGQLAAVVAHEVNNPLSYVITNLEYCREGLRSAAAGASMPALAEALAEAREGAERVRRIVSDLRSFVRDAEETVGIVPLRRVAISALRMVRAEIAHRATCNERYLDAPLVRGDERRLEQVLVNLLLNAAQAIPEGNVQGNSITLEVATEGDQAVVRVVDTGSGIADEHLQRVTEAFFTTKSDGFGTGLGLTVSRNVVEACGGRLEITSRMGEGTSVMLRFPLVEADVSAPSQAKEPARAAEAAAGRRLRILVVDDDPLILRSVTRALRGDDVVTAAGGRPALTILETDTRFDAVLCDVMMPDLSGIDVHQELAQKAPELARRFVFFTGGTFTARASEYLRNTDLPRVEKPFDPYQLRRLLSGLAPPG